MRENFWHFSFNRLIAIAAISGLLWPTLGASTETSFTTENLNVVGSIGSSTSKIDQERPMAMIVATMTTTTSRQKTPDHQTSSLTSLSTSSSSSSSFSIPSTAASTTAKPTTASSVRSSSTFPFDFSLSKQHWTKNEDTATVHKTIPMHAYQNKHHHEHHWGPFFEEPLNTSEGTLHVAAHLFTEAILNCRVGMLRDKTVMWIRRTSEKVSLLTVGNITYSGDPRVRVKFQYPNNWRLIINPVQKDDASLYICQVSTHPPRVFATNLTILEPPIRIIDEQGHEVRDRYYKAGSKVELTCQVSRHFVSTQKKTLLKQSATESSSKMSPPPLPVAMISNSNSSNSTSIFDDRIIELIQWRKDGGVMPAKTNSNFSSTLEWYNNRITIAHANFSENGIYSCSIAKLYEAIVNVQVLTGELPAAVQHNSSRSKLFINCSNIIQFLIILQILLYISPTI